MAATKPPRVPFTTENIKKCVCGRCPVQTGSRCVKDKKPGIAEALNRQPLQAAAILYAYCASGKAACADLDMSKMCMCPACPVYEAYSLSTTTPVDYYCGDGMAK